MGGGGGSHAKNFSKNGEATNNPSKVSNVFVNYYTSIMTELRKNLFPLNAVAWRKVKQLKQIKGLN